MLSNSYYIEMFLSSQQHLLFHTLLYTQGMCHSHTNKLILSDKLKAMKDCYLNSSVPPKLHIDIPQHMADTIFHKDAGPYVFREAQTTIFRHLYSYWQEYQLLCHPLTSTTEISAEIEKMRVKMEQLRKVDFIKL